MEIQTIAEVLGIVAFVFVVCMVMFGGRAENVSELRKSLKHEEARADRNVRRYAAEKGKSKRRESQDWCDKNRPPKLEGL